MPWIQNYDPLGNLFASTLVASLPIIVLLGLLAFFHLKTHYAALAGLVVSFIVATLIYKMPLALAGAAALYGAAFGLFPIGWIVIGVIFLYDITVATGKFDVLKSTIANLTDDRRLQALLIAFSFGAFIEGAAGFGTPVAISAAILIGLGFDPLLAASLSLIGNTAPVAFGSLGTPIIALAKVTNLDVERLSAMVGRQLPFFSLFVPFCLVWAMSGRRGVRGVWPACLVTGGAFGLTQFVVSNYHGPWIVDLLAAGASVLALLLLLRVWRPRDGAEYAHDEQSRGTHAAAATFASLSRREVLLAWSPWVLLSVLVFVWGLPPVKNFLNASAFIEIHVPVLDRNVWRAPPVVAQAKAEDAVFVFNWLSATGTILLLTGFTSGLLLGVRPLRLVRIFGGTLRRVRYSLLTITAMLALGFTTRYGGLDATLGLAFASTGFLFPFFSPLLGWLGVALTGSDTSSNVLFGNLQQITASRVGVSPILAAAANSSGGVMGKMIDAQSIVVAGVATNQTGNEGRILRSVFWYSLILAVTVGLFVLAQAYLFSWMIP